ncbi:hypothetical protein RJ640_029968 [Escallonia rubra]|uniref:Uncharacterized protein n=1 Tax=Escallonia rubra TaxID=112253 RepID=A0AA88UNX6_9ASTE|nr:hypothetical protein RJ640_029968 [Escallonia rubra]
MGILTAALVIPSKLKPSSLTQQQSSLFLHRRRRPKKNLSIVPLLSSSLPDLLHSPSLLPQISSKFMKPPGKVINGSIVTN